MIRWLPLLGAALMCCSCSMLPANVEREPSFALANPRVTSLGEAFAKDIAAHPGESGFLPVLAGANAYLLRAAMAGLAERTLDLQYYLWADDTSGRMMLGDVLRAADRGVRVRLLLDDIHTDGEIVTFAQVDAHPNIEVRLFNPFGRRSARVADWLLDGARLNHRMHNKAMIADNAVAIAGGRNIGNHYFAIDEVSNFRDLDLLAIGPIVQDLSSMFDLYWNSEWSYPLTAIEGEEHSAHDAVELGARLDRWMRVATMPFTLDHDAHAMRARLFTAREKLSWGQGEAVFDSPARVDGTDKAVRGVADVLFDTVDGVRRELLIETAYFVPGERGVARLGGLVERGVDVTVLTNSLATNDVLAAHAGYMDYREALLDAGVKLHELRPDAHAQQQQLSVLASESESTLHTKALVYDRRAVFVGSFNYDPRSLVINMEMGVLVHSRELAATIAATIREGLEPANSYQLALHDGEIRWQTVIDGEAVCLDNEPETGWWERFLANLLSLMPIDDQL